MNTYNFDTPIDRRGTDSLKWKVYKNHDIIPMWVADMDFQSPPAVIEALRKRVEHGVYGYTVPPKALTDTIRERLYNLYGWEIKPQWLVWLPGLVSGINVACRAVGDKGDEVLTTVPVYPPFLTAPLNVERQLLTFRMSCIEEKWRFDFNAFEKTISPATRLFILCHPHNPLGRVFSKKELVKLAEICERHDMIICSDEIHCDLILDKDKNHQPTASLSPEIADRTITLMAPSKTYNIAGLGCSFAIISNPVLRREFERAMAGIVPHLNCFSYTAGLAGYRYGNEWLTQVLGYLRENRKIVERAISDMPGLSMTHVEATYLAWIDARDLETDDPYKFFEKAGVGLSDGKYFDGQGFVRLNFGCPLKILNKGLERMRETVD